MKQTLPLLAVALLLSACMKKLTTQNIIPTQHLQKVALLQSIEKAKGECDCCEETNELAYEIARMSVAQAVAAQGIGCDDPPCDWPDTIPVVMLSDPKAPGTATLMYYPCDDPPCDWPDTIPYPALHELAIGYVPLPGQAYEFEIAGAGNKQVAYSKPALVKGSKPARPGRLARATFTVADPKFSGDAWLRVRRKGPGQEGESVYAVPVKIFNPGKR
ncbi:MAG: hypothetical protein KDD10_19795 [Phaeodactylibacter sp.]|nr:hypothetical protein [Phaeodactylibacter sp.]MCB9291820.1 hypothetical protein [Lewinellaceae bacterium]